MTKRSFVLMTVRSFARSPVTSGLLAVQIVICTLLLAGGLSLSRGELDRISVLERRLDGVVQCSQHFYERDGQYHGYEVDYAHIAAVGLDPSPGIIVHMGFIENGDEDYFYTIEAVNPEFVELIGLRLRSGCWPWECDDPAQVCVLTAELAGIMFGADDPLGRQVGDRTVTGVLEPGAVIPGAKTIPHSHLSPGATIQLFCCMNGKLVVYDPGLHRTPNPADLWFGPEHDLEALVLSLQRQLDVDGPPVMFQSWYRYAAVETEERRQLTVALNNSGLQLFAASAFGMMGLMALTIPRRRTSLALELALGATPRLLAGRMVAEYVALSGTSLVVAAVLYVAGRSIVTRIDSTLHWSLSPAVWVPVLAAHILLALAACALPVMAALRLSPRRALDGG